MLRRSVTALLVVTAVCMVGCGIKGPLKLPPAKPGAPETPAPPPPVRMGDETPDRTVPDVEPEGGK